jgi:hypothetical protein
MYIIHETVAGNDPRLLPSMEIAGGYWIYTIRRVPDDLPSAYIDWLKAEVITESVARAYKFCGAKDNEITVRKTTTVYEEIASASSEADMSQGPKMYYYLTGEDVVNTTNLLKVIMLNHTNNHLKNQEVKPHLVKLINSCKTIEDTHWMLATYFSCENATTYGKPRTPLISVEWQ